METIRRLWKKYREVLLYLIFGGLTTLVNYAALWLFYDVLGIRKGKALGANALAWVVAVLFAFVTNKLLVFASKSTDRATVTRETVSFFLARLFSLGLETAVLWLGDNQLGINTWIVKLAASVIVVAMNYIFSKWLIFKKAEPQSQEQDRVNGK